MVCVLLILLLILEVAKSHSLNKCSNAAADAKITYVGSYPATKYSIIWFGVLSNEE